MLTWNFFFVGSFTEKTIRINQIEKLWQRNYYNHKEHNHFREPGFNLNIRQSLRELANARFLPVWSATFLLGLLDAPVNALLPVYVEVELGESPLLSAGLRSTFLLLGGVCAVPAGYLCDNIGIKPTYLLGVTGTIAAGAIFILHQPVWLFVLCLYIGMATGFSTTASQAYLIKAAPRTSLGLGAAAFFLGMTLGSAIGSRLAGQIADIYGFSSVGLAVIIGVFLVMAGMIFFMPEISNRPTSTVKSKTSHLILLARPNVRLLLAIRFLPTCYWGTATLLIPLLIYRASQSLTLAADYSAVSLTIAAVTQLITGRLADKFGPRVPTLIVSTCVAISAICIGIWSDSVEGLFLFGTTGAAAAWSVSTMMPRLIDEVTGPLEKGRMVGMAHLAWSLAMLSGSLWGGSAVKWSTSLPFFVVAAGCIATVVCLAVLFQRLERQQEGAQVNR